MSIFEIIMLICFGSAWPFAIAKSYRSRSNGGKSLFFLIIIVIGYIMGIMHKVFYNFDAVVYLYLFNGLMVGVDIGLYLRNRRIGREQNYAV